VTILRGVGTSMSSSAGVGEGLWGAVVIGVLA